MRGFDTDPTKPLTGGIQTTGSYPGRARTPQELMADIEEVLKLCPGTKKLNLHASYAIFTDGEWVDRSQLEPKHFAPWNSAKSTASAQILTPLLLPSQVRPADAKLSQRGNPSILGEPRQSLRAHLPVPCRRAGRYGHHEHLDRGPVTDNMEIVGAILHWS